MDPLLKTALWQQFGGTIDMLENALLVCPDTLWNGLLWNTRPDDPVPPEIAAFWYLTYHTLFWLDLYLSSLSEEEFAPPPPFTLSELDPAGVVPEPPYTKDELHNYLLHLRQKCQTTIMNLSDEKAHYMVSFPWTARRPTSFFELLMYNMRHVQEHASQLNLFLGQHAVEGVSDWVPWAGADRDEE